MRFDPIVHLGFRGSFDYQLGAFDFVLSRYVTFDSRQVESDATSHWVEITPHTPDHTASFEILAEVTQFGDHLDLDANDELVLDSSAAGGHILDTAIGSPQMEVFDLYQFGAAISCRSISDIGEELQTFLFV